MPPSNMPVWHKDDLELRQLGKKNKNRLNMNFLPLPICLGADYKSPCEGCRHPTVPERGHQPCHLRLQGTQKSIANLARDSLSSISFFYVCIFSQFATPKHYIPFFVLSLIYKFIVLVKLPYKF